VKAAVAAAPPSLLLAAAPPPSLLHAAQEVTGDRVLSSHAEKESSDEAGGPHPTENLLLSLPFHTYLSLPLEEQEKEKEKEEDAQARDRVQDAWQEKGRQSRLVGNLLSADARTNGMLTYADVC